MSTRQMYPILHQTWVAAGDGGVGVGGGVGGRDPM